MAIIQTWLCIGTYCLIRLQVSGGYACASQTQVAAAGRAWLPCRTQTAMQSRTQRAGGCMMTWMPAWGSKGCR